MFVVLLSVIAAVGDTLREKWPNTDTLHAVIV